MHKLPWEKFMTGKLLKKKNYGEKYYPQIFLCHSKAKYGLVNGKNTETEIFISRYSKANTDFVMHLLK